MPELLLLKSRSPEAARSPELGHLSALCEREARRAFGSVETLFLDAGAPLPAAPRGETPFVLLLGSRSVFVGARSLEAARGSLAAGADLACPAPLTRAGTPSGEEIRTLRQYELLEARILDGHGASWRPDSHLPVSLWRGPSFRDALARHGLEPLLREGAIPLPEGHVAAGVYHELADYYGQVREDALPHVPPGVRDVLEVGCGRGGTGELLERRLGCRVTGVEQNPVVAAQAGARISRVLCGDVRSLELSDRFDLILAFELLEHVDDGDLLLHRMREWCRPGGRILLSVPNVGHYAVVEDLIAGRWDYVPIGPLCSTHLRFFTRTTLEDQLRRCGFSRFEIIPQRGPLPDRVRRLGELLEVDEESLATTGFIATVDV